MSISSWTIEQHEELNSTQDVARSKAVEGVAQGFVVQAQTQKAGRGRFNRVWESAPGNLYISFILRPECMVSRIGQISLLIGLAVSTALNKFVKGKDIVTLKWPNDVLLNGEKCAGILIESDVNEDHTLNFVIAGIGLNIRNAPEEFGACVCDFSKDRDISVDSVRDQVLKEIAHFYKVWNKSGFDDIRTQWMKCGHKKDSPISVRLGQKNVQGVFCDIDGQGGLVVYDTQDQRRRTMTAGEVFTV